MTATPYMDEHVLEGACGLYEQPQKVWKSFGGVVTESDSTPSTPIFTQNEGVPKWLSFLGSKANRYLRHVWVEHPRSGRSGHPLHVRFDKLSQKWLPELR